jgi:pepF/M3 family oligoendopeptidase
MTTTTIEAAETLPRWDLDSIFPGPESAEFRAALAHIASATKELEDLFDREGIGRRPAASSLESTVATVETVIDRYNALLDLAMRVDGYLFCLVAADVRDEAAQSAAGAWRQQQADLARLAPRFVNWIGMLDVEALALRSETVNEHVPALRRLRTAAAHLMAPGEEDLAAVLGPTGAAAWAALRDDLAGRATGHIELDGLEQELPLSEIENLRYNPDRDVRRRAFEAREAAWRTLAVPLTSALNGVKGQQLTLALRRGWESPLDQALFANAIDRAVLDALMQAIVEALPDYHHYLRVKARLLGLSVLAGYDLFAPVGELTPWPYDTARAFIIEQFTRYSPRLGALAERAFRERWIDAGPREGKDGGAFSMPVGNEQSRIFANYLPVYDWMSALAHELGHSYHVVAIAERGRTFLQAPAEMAGTPASFPMTLAETASTICEAIVQRAARAGATPVQEVSLLDGWLQALSLNVFGTLPMFNLERQIFTARGSRELSTQELQEMSANAWREVAGDTIDPATVRSTDWTIPHLFIDNVWFYNFPYAFGMLFGLGLLAVRDANPEGFFDRFDTLLADSGMREANELAADFGIDLRDPAFWRASLDTFRADVDRYDALSQSIAVPDGYRADPAPEMQPMTKSHNGSDAG